MSASFKLQELYHWKGIKTMTEKNQSSLCRLVRPLARNHLVRYFLDKLYRFINTFIQKERVAMLHIGRCGSSVLGNMLDAHTKIYWAGEIFEDYTHGDNSVDKAALVGKIFNEKCHRKTSRIFGFETKYLPQQHLSHKCINMDLGNYIDLLRKLDVTKYIVLHRKNYLRYVAKPLKEKLSSLEKEKKIELKENVRKNTLQYTKRNGIIEFPWEVLILTAKN